MAQNKQQKGTAAKRYEALSQSRADYLERGRECCKLTLPMLLPEDDETGKRSFTKIKTPYQGLGAEGVNTLSAKMMLALIPPNQPMFRLRPSAEIRKEAGEQTGEVEKALSELEQFIQEDIESSGDRPTLHEAFLHLLTVGNYLIYDSNEGLRGFPLFQYVISRDPLGRPIEFVIKEEVYADALPAKLVKSLNSVLPSEDQMPSEEPAPDTEYSTTEKTYSVYTHGRLRESSWHCYQECQGTVLPNTAAKYPKEACPYIPLRMIAVSGEDYGRSYVENYLGDLKSLEALSQAVLEAAAASSKVLFLVQPNGVTDAKDLASAANCAFAPGRADDVSTLQVGKHSDLQVPYQSAQTITQRLSRAFLLLTATRRDAERVTAEEIRVVAEELETAQCGIYSTLSQGFQKPYIKNKMRRLAARAKIPALNGSWINIEVTTGFEALGRGNDRIKLNNFLTAAQALLGAEQFTLYVNVSDALNRLAAAEGINTAGLIKTAEEVEQIKQQAQMQEMAQQVAPQAVSAMENAAGMEQPAAEQPL